MKRTVRISVEMPVWYDMEVEIDVDDIDATELTDEQVNEVIDRFDFSKCEEHGEWKFRNNNGVMIFDVDKHEALYEE